MPSSQGREQLFLKILVFFAVITAITGIFNEANSGAITLGDLGGGTIPGQVTPDLSTATAGASSQTVNTLDYTNSTGYISNTTVANSGWIRTDGVGWTSDVGGFFGLLQGTAYISVAGTKMNNGIYDNTYHFNNPSQSNPVYFAIEGGTNSENQISAWFVQCDYNGISIVAAPTLPPYSSINYPRSNLASTIETKYNPANRVVEILVDGVDAGGLNVPANNGGQTGTFTIYTGMAVINSGIILSSIDGAFGYGSTYAPNPLSELINALGQAVAIAGMFFSTIGAILGLSSSAVVPFWLWAIIALPCLATLILIYLEMARGN